MSENTVVPATTTAITDIEIGIDYAMMASDFFAKRVRAQVVSSAVWSYLSNAAYALDREANAVLYSNPLSDDVRAELARKDASGLDRLSFALSYAYTPNEVPVATKTVDEFLASNAPKEYGAGDKDFERIVTSKMATSEMSRARVVTMLQQEDDRARERIATTRPQLVAMLEQALLSAQQARDYAFVPDMFVQRAMLESLLRTIDFQLNGERFGLYTKLRTLRGRAYISAVNELEHLEPLIIQLRAGVDVLTRQIEEHEERQFQEAGSETPEARFSNDQLAMWDPQTETREDFAARCGTSIS